MVSCDLKWKELAMIVCLKQKKVENSPRHSLRAPPQDMNSENMIQ